MIDLENTIFLDKLSMEDFLNGKALPVDSGMTINGVKIYTMKTTEDVIKETIERILNDELPQVSLSQIVRD